ncbi:MAG: DUF4190 domain-containing protein [Lachnospiraceae bacterium]|jgi:hypothetical protein|nr:DUF4190 domain-containing protein [Lachnospiraceae bacterium]
MQNNSIFCQACGSEQGRGNTFCLNCGERLQIVTENPYQNPAYEAAAIPTVTGEVVPPPPPSATTNNPYQSEPGSTYQAPPVYTQTNTAAVRKNGGLAIASLVCGIVSLPCCYAGIGVGIAAVILGIISLTKKQEGRGLAIAGIIMGGIGFFIWCAIVIFGVYSAFFATEVLENIWYQYY